MLTITVVLEYNDEKKLVQIPISSNTVENTKRDLFVMLKEKFPNCTIKEYDEELFKLFIGEGKRTLKDESKLEEHASLSFITYRKSE